MRLCGTITISQLFSEHSSFRMSLSCHYRKCIHDYHQEVLIFRVTFLSSSRNTERQSLGKTLLISRCLTSRFCKNNEERVQKIEFWQAVSRFSMVNQLNRQRFSTYHHSLNGNILGTSKAQCILSRQNVAQVCSIQIYNQGSGNVMYQNSSRYRSLKCKFFFGEKLRRKFNFSSCPFTFIPFYRIQ